MALTERFRRSAAQLGVPLGASTTPIQPVLLGSSRAALLAQQELMHAGFWVVAIRPPTVPRGSARLRVTLSAAHTEAQVDSLVETLARVCARSDAAPADVAPVKAARADAAPPAESVSQRRRASAARN
jgi:8-amino-7-oxononanoate synthase